MSLISRRKRPLDRKTSVRDAKLFIIAVEGEKTEKHYFEFKAFCSTRIQVKVLPTDSERHDSSPERVLQRLDDFKKRYELNASDELWLVVDVDRWGDGKLSQVCREAIKKGFRMAVSNPCFEVWLCLHYFDLDSSDSCRELEKRLRAYLGGYNKANLREADFSPHINVAIERARRLDGGTTARWPASVGSHVYKLVESVRTSLVRERLAV